MIYDFIVIGSGSVGAAAGYYASQAGLKTLMIDIGHPPHDQGSHHGDTRQMPHAYGKDEKYVPFVLRAQKLWDELAATSGKKVFHRTGVLNIVPADSSPLENITSTAEKYSLPIEKLDAAAITARWPEFVVSEKYVGIFEPNAGMLKSELAIETYISLAKQNGSEQLFNCKVTDIRHSEEAITVVTENGEYQGRKVLVSAGTWVTKLLPELPITPVRKIIAWHQVDCRYSEDNKFPCFTATLVNDNMFYGFPAQDNEFKLAQHTGGQPIDVPEERIPYGAHPSDETDLLPFLRKFLPGVGSCLRGKACTYDISPDHDFIVDTLPGNNNTLVISGLSGHGFKFSSVLGEIASQFAQGQKPSFDMSPFALSRFKTV